MSATGSNGHDPLCPNSEGVCCPWMGECNCQCLCDFILRVRRDESNKIFQTIAKSIVPVPRGLFKAKKYYEGRNEVLRSLMAWLEVRTVQRSIR